MHEQQKVFEDEQKVNNLKRKPFNAKINKESLDNATRVKERKMKGTGNTMDTNPGHNYYDDMDAYENNGMDLLDDGGAQADLDAKLEME